MKIVWAMVDGGGNLPPQLAVARTLRERGAEVHVLGHRGIRERVDAAGLAFEPFVAGRHFDPTRKRPLALMMADFARMAADPGIGRDIVDAARRHRADVVVVDVIPTAGIQHVVSSEFPTVVFVHCFYRAAQDLAATPVGMLLRARGIRPADVERADVLHVVSARADLDPVRGHPPVRHTGVVWQGAPTASCPTDKPRVLVSLSTCAFAGQHGMLQRILDAAAPLDVDVTVTTGPGIDGAGLRVPPNASLHRWLDHDEVLSSASLLIGHGGHSTTMRALSFGVPVLVLPANPLIDQKRVGQAIEGVGAGMLLGKHARSGRIRRAIRAMLYSETYRAAASEYGAHIREVDGALTAADAIGDFVSRRSHVDSTR